MLDARALIQSLIFEVWASETSANAEDASKAIATLANASSHIAHVEAREQEAHHAA
jgi:hypothetical protein